jgi:hypothetical protein
MQLWLRVTLVLGLFFFAGVLIMVADLLNIRPARKTEG